MEPDLAGRQARYILIDPENTDILYVSTGIFDREAANSDHVRGISGGVGVLKSTDGGSSWTKAKDGLENLYVGSLVMHPENPRILLAGTGNVRFSRNNGVYISANGGESWQISNGEHSSTSVEFSPSNPDIAYSADGNVFFRSENGGRTWDQMTPLTWNWGPPGAAVGTPIDFEIDPRNPDRIFVNAYGGRTWDYASRGYTGAQVRDIEAFPGAGSSPQPEAGFLRLMTGAGTGSAWPTGITSNWTGTPWPFILINRILSLSELTCPRELVRSTDGGRTWNKVDQMPEGIAWNAIEFSPSDPNVVYAGTTGFNSCGSFAAGYPALGMRRSNDAGIHWVDANDEETVDLSVISIAVHPENPDIVYLGSDDQGLWRSEDGGVSWKIVGRQTFRERRIEYVGYHPLDPNVVLWELKKAGSK